MVIPPSLMEGENFLYTIPYALAGDLLVSQCHAKKLNRFHLNCLRKVLKIKWQDQISETEVLAHADMISLQTLLMNYWLRWTGHVIRMQDTRLFKKLLFGQLSFLSVLLEGCTPRSCGEGIYIVNGVISS